MRTIVFGQPVTDEQRVRLLYIAKNCPAARLLAGEIVLDTVLDETLSEDSAAARR